MKILRMLLLLFAVCFCSTGVFGDEEVTATITQYGRYKAVVLATNPTEQKVSGGVLVKSEKIEHLETTTIIPCKLDEKWGFTVKFAGLPTNRPFKYRSEVHHPPIKQPSGEILTKSVSEATLKAGTNPSGHKIWHFLKGYEYELVPGKWTREIYIDGVEVASMTFDIND
jgi:hypothetical protein